MSEQNVNFSVDSGLLRAFSHAAARNSCSDTELLKAFMADYVQQDVRKQHYEDWFRSKVRQGLAELERGEGFSQAESTAQMAAFKTSLRKGAESAPDGAADRAGCPAGTASGDPVL